MSQVIYQRVAGEGIVPVQIICRGHSSVGRAPALQAGGRRFDSAWLHCERAVARRRADGGPDPPAQITHASILRNTQVEEVHESQTVSRNGRLACCPCGARSVHPTGVVAGRRDGNARTACHLPGLRFLRRSLRPTRAYLCGPRPRPRGRRCPHPRDPRGHGRGRRGADVRPHRPGSVPGDGLLDASHHQRGRDGGRGTRWIPPHAPSDPRAVPDANVDAGPTAGRRRSFGGGRKPADAARRRSMGQLDNRDVLGRQRRFRVPAAGLRHALRCVYQPRDGGLEAPVSAVLQLQLRPL